MKKIGFIGCGKMAGAIIRGIIGSGFAKSQNLLASKSSPENIDKISNELGIRVITDNEALTRDSDVVFVAVKPNQVKAVLNEIRECYSEDKLIVSVAAGITTSFIEENLNPKACVVRVMPNTPVLVREGMSGICSGKNATDEDIEYVQALFNTIGRTIITEESNFDTVTAISGSGPAFFYKVINDIARAGEALGLEYEKSLELSIQTAIGAGKMAMNRSVSMEELISNVATKGGCTFSGVEVMEKAALDKVLFDVIKSTAEKSSLLGK